MMMMMMMMVVMMMIMMMMMMMMMIHASKKVWSSPLDTASRSQGLSLWRCGRKARPVP